MRMYVSYVVFNLLLTFLGRPSTRVDGLGRLQRLGEGLEGQGGEASAGGCPAPRAGQFDETAPYPPHRLTHRKLVDAETQNR